MLTRLVKELIDSENWHGLSADVKGDAYESLLERNAQDVKTGAGQYFTPRPLIQAIVDVMRPGPDTTICDPACGTAGGFLLAAHEYVHQHNPTMNREQSEFLRNDAPHGWEIVDSAARLGVMNLYLHGIGGDQSNIRVDDSLRAQPSDHYDMVLTNPPFGRTSTLTFVNEEGRTERQSLTVERPDFWATTSNRQLRLPAARPHAAENQRQRGHRAAGQRAVRGWRRRDHPPPDAPRVRRPHPAAAAHGRVLRPGGQGQRAVLRPQAGQRDAVGRGTCGSTTCAPTSASR